MASHPVLLLLLTTMGSVLAASVAQAPAPAPVDNVLRPTVPSCSTTGNYTAGDQYQKNLADLLATMPAAAINNSWFYAGSAGTGADQVHGLIVCYADRNATQCEDCLTRGPAGIASSVCPGSRRVNAAYDACVLRYADEPVSGEADNDVAFYVYEATGADVDDSFALDVARSDLMDELARKAAAAEMRVANGSAPCAGAAEDVYGMAQCTRDLASEQCASCLEEYVEKIGEVFGDWTGGAIKGYSCYVRYRIGAFDITLPPAPSTPPPAAATPPPAPATPPLSPPPAPATPPSSPPPAAATPPPAPATPPSSPPPAAATPPPASATPPASPPPAPATPPSSPPPAAVTLPPAPSTPPTPSSPPPAAATPPPAPATPPSSPPPAAATPPPASTTPPSSPPSAPPPTQPSSPPPVPVTQPPSSPPTPAAELPSPPPCPCQS